jgi:hypothetical protein
VGQDSDGGAPFKAILKSIKEAEAEAVFEAVLETVEAAVFEAILETVETLPVKARIEGPIPEARREPPTWTLVRAVMQTTSRMLSVNLAGAA